MNEYEESNATQDPDDLDKAIDAALAKYASVEPRSGLEQRILANLSAQPHDAGRRVWWRWGLAAALAVGLLVAALAWRAGRSSRPLVTNHPAGVNAGQKIANRNNAARAPEQRPLIQRSRVQRVRHAQRRSARDVRIVQTTAPKREHFPSPQPLSEQEKLLASYVANDPHNAILIARAQAELEKQDQEEEMREMNPNQNSQQIQQ